MFVFIWTLMPLSSTLNRIHAEAKQNKWLRYFAVFNRIALAAGFLPSGYVKIAGERFTALSNNHPLGHYLEALHHTGYYYTFIGVAQVTAAILLLIPQTATLGALLYFPIILNISVLVQATRFDGGIMAPLMTLASLYLLCWNYDRIKYIFPFNQPPLPDNLYTQKALNTTFPTKFFVGVLATVVTVILLLLNVYRNSIMPRNILPDCELQCRNSPNPEACHEFCDCIHVKGQPLDSCLSQYDKAMKSTIHIK
ncbi:hypothetical protein GCM10028807_18580 [Spirosoma daeguense]